jgi:hypothetical protein
MEQAGPEVKTPAGSRPGQAHFFALCDFFLAAVFLLRPGAGLAFTGFSAYARKNIEELADKMKICSSFLYIYWLL